MITSNFLQGFAARLFFSIVLLTGCSTTSQVDYPIPPIAKHDPLPESEALSQRSEISNLADQISVSKVDEANCVYFMLGSSAVAPSEKAKLELAAARLKEDRGLYIKLVGNANHNGSRSLNLAVADSRVETVATVLKSLGVNSRQIKKIVVGGERTPVTCRSEECQRKMRRVELSISKAKY